MRVPQGATRGRPPGMGGYGYVPPDADADGPPVVAEPAGAELLMPPKLPPFTAPFGCAPGVANGTAPSTNGTAPDRSDPDDWEQGPVDPGWVDELAGAHSDHWPGHGALHEPGADDLPPDPLTYQEDDIHWFATPAGFGGCVRLGYVHTDRQCPVMVFRVTNEQTGQHIDLIGSWQGIVDLSIFLGDSTESLVCGARHLPGPQPVRGPLVRH